MEQDERDEPRAANDSRKRTPVESGKVATVESKPSLGKRWRDYQPTKTAIFWACLASIVLTMIVGFNWGGWVTGGSAQKTAETMARNAVIERLAPICVAQFNLDPDKALKLGEMNELSSYKQRQYVQDQGWATISGEEKPERNVATACTNLLLEMSP